MSEVLAAAGLSGSVSGSISMRYISSELIRCIGGSLSELVMSALAGLRRTPIGPSGSRARPAPSSDCSSARPGDVRDAVEEEMRPLRAFDLDYAVKRVEPLLGFNRVRVAGVIQCNLPGGCLSSWVRRACSLIDDV